MNISKTKAINFIILPVPFFTGLYLIRLLSDIFDLEMLKSLCDWMLAISFVGMIALIPLGFIALRGSNHKK